MSSTAQPVPTVPPRTPVSTASPRVTNVTKAKAEELRPGDIVMSVNRTVATTLLSPSWINRDVVILFTDGSWIPMDADASEVVQRLRWDQISPDFALYLQKRYEAGGYMVQDSDVRRLWHQTASIVLDQEVGNEDEDELSPTEQAQLNDEIKRRVKDGLDILIFGKPKTEQA